MQALKNHIDGKWWTSEYNYEGYKLHIKMRENHGAKIHIWNKENTKVIKTFRFGFASKNHMINKAKYYINTIK